MRCCGEAARWADGCLIAVEATSIVRGIEPGADVQGRSHGALDFLVHARIGAGGSPAGANSIHA